ncbi:phage major capsid protein [Luteolibacter pohnpeiensis]|uniref:Phage major capsid protein n=1 Tax=Luteolibacter pohnpeiensis TaxID=454153 RepID=A0A934VX88_9BACT|nr:phage major capsid protein [Luteolibacter pohnpeiensis]MBK1884105.1 phage major capsid protein [Luteolibacter pohnpeiensis]
MKLNRSNRFKTPWLTVAIFAGLAGLGFCHDRTGTTSLATLACMGIPQRKMDDDPDNNGGGDFEKKVLAGVGAIKKQVGEMESRFATTDQEAKKLSEDFSNHIKNFEGLPGQIQDMTRTIQQIQLKQNNERRAIGGSIVERISADDEKRNIINGLFRMGIDPTGQRVKTNEDQRKAVENYQRAMSTGATPGSAYLVEELNTEVYSLIASYGIWGDFDVIPVSTKSIRMIVDTTDPNMGWATEGIAPAESSYAGGPVSATIGKMLGWIGVSSELLEDSEVNLVPYLLPKFANACAYRLDWSCLSADGTADVTDGGYTGIFYSGTASVAATGNVSVETLDQEDFTKTMLAVNPAVLSRPSMWWTHPQNLIRMLAIKDGNGRSIFLPAIDAPSPGGIGSILGSPVRLSHAAPNANTTSSKIATFGDPKGQAVCLRKDFDFATSADAKFTEDQVVFRARARAATKTKAADAFGVLTNAAA